MRIADALLDRVQDKGEMDLIDDYAFPLPIIVIAELLGLPLEDRDRLRVWSQSFISPIRDDDEYQEFEALMQEFTLYLADLFAKRRRDPRDDLISALVQAEEEGGDTGAAAADAVVVPEPGGALVGNSAREDRVGRTLDPASPFVVARDLPEAEEESRGAGRAVAPAQVKEVLALRLVVEQQPFVGGGRAQVGRAVQSGVEEGRIGRGAVELGEEVGHTGGAV